jgi:hypothetical protein
MRRAGVWMPCAREGRLPLSNSNEKPGRQAPSIAAHRAVCQGWKPARAETPLAPFTTARRRRRTVNRKNGAIPHQTGVWIYFSWPINCLARTGIISRGKSLRGLKCGSTTPWPPSILLARPNVAVSRISGGRLIYLVLTNHMINYKVARLASFLTIKEGRDCVI